MQLTTTAVPTATRSMSRLIRLSACLALFAGGVAEAVDPRVYQLGDGGAVAPHLTVEIGSDNNPLRRNEGSEASQFLRLQPDMRYIVQQRNNRLVVGYSGDYVQYFEDYCRDQLGNGVSRPGDCQNGSPAFNKASYEDHRFFANASLEVNRQIRATLTLSRELENQPLGTGLSSNTNTLLTLVEPDAFNRTIARAEVSYGAPQARGEIRAGITYTDKEFQNDNANPQRNPEFENLNEHSLAPSVALLYRLGTRTQIFGGLGQSEVRGGNSERDISSRFVGLEFDASAITSGSIRLTDVTEDFVANRRDLNYTGWDVELTWKPRRYSTVTIGGGRETERGLFNDDIGISTTLDLNWLHYWKERVSTDINVNWENNEDVDEFSSQAENSTADDATLSIRIGGNYNIRRWLDIGAFVETETRDGRAAARDYDRTVIGVTANGTI